MCHSSQVFISCILIGAFSQKEMATFLLWVFYYFGLLTWQMSSIKQTMCTLSRASSDFINWIDVAEKPATALLSSRLIIHQSNFVFMALFVYHISGLFWHILIYLSNMWIIRLVYFYSLISTRFASVAICCSSESCRFPPRYWFFFWNDQFGGLPYFFVISGHPFIKESYFEDVSPGLFHAFENPCSDTLVMKLSMRVALVYSPQKKF